MNVILDLRCWWTYYRHNVWWGKWTCPICVRWAWDDWRSRRREAP